jgi:hypothetical protein
MPTASSHYCVDNHRSVDNCDSVLRKARDPVNIRCSVERCPVMLSSTVCTHETAEGRFNAMTVNQSQSPACTAHHCSAHFVSRIPAEPGDIARRSCPSPQLWWREDSPAQNSRHPRWVGAQSAHKRGCGHCPHPGLRIRLYRRRTGPDWGCLRKSGRFAGGAAGSSPISGTCFPCSEAF